LTLYGIDNWGYVADPRYEKRNEDDGPYRMTLENLKPHIETGKYIVVKKTSMDALVDIPDLSLDFVFIDADHRYNSVKEDVDGWSKKVRMGGIVSGHDYYESTPGKYVGKNAKYALGVIKAVDEFIQKTGYTLQIIDWDRENPDRDSRPPCWFFKKDK
jgi:predicted O-methyltransferase YrrM